MLKKTRKKLVLLRCYTNKRFRLENTSVSSILRVKRFTISTTYERIAKLVPSSSLLIVSGFMFSSKKCW